MLISLFALIACGGPATTAPTAAPETPADPMPAKPDDHGHDHGADGKSPGADGHTHGDAAAETEKPPAGAKVMFVGLENGAVVKSPLKIQMGVEGMTVEPAGKLISGTGHHHLIIDAEAPAFNTAVAKDENHIHYGGGQTEAEVELTPGEHRLTLQFADGVHRSYGPELSTSVTVTVE